MKRGTPNHKKMHALAEILEIPLPFAVGIMEMLWHYASTSTPEGDLGSVPNAAIARAIGWDKKPDRLIAALIASGWLDVNEKYRFVIHDWPDHCEQSVDRWLKRNHKTFLPVYSQCPVTDYTVTSQKLDNNYLSREATAKAEAKAMASSGSEEEKKDAPFTVPNLGAEFQRVISAFLMAGVALSDAMMYQAAQEWHSQVPEAEQEMAAACAEKRAREHEKRFMGLPASWLRKHEWRARGPGRMLPEPRTPTKGEVAQERATAAFLREKGVANA